jgi:hypothetical protein
VALLDSVFVVAILIAIVATPFFFIAWFNGSSPHKRWRASSVIALLFPICIVLGWLVSLTSTSIAQSQVAEFLESVSDHCTISVDGRIVQNRDQVLATLKGFANLPAHHSSPTRELHVDISDPPRHLQLVLARDSSDAHEYWVFAPSPSKLAARLAMKKDIGHIKTSVFDAY